MLQEKRFNTGTVDINFAQGPANGPPLVLLHGLPGHWQEFLPVIPALSLEHQIFALDARGQGKSGRALGEYKAKYYLDDLEQFLLEQLDEPAVLFGQSAGGWAVLGAAARRPELVRAVIVGDAPLDIDHLIQWMTSEPFQSYFSALREIAGLESTTAGLVNEIANIPIDVPGQNDPIRYGDSPGVDLGRIQQLAAVLNPMDPDVLEYHAEGRALEFLEGLSLDEVLAPVSYDVLLLQGNPALGGMLSDEIIRHIQSILPAARHVCIESAGHDLGLDAWETGPLLRAAASFLGTV